MSYNSGITVEEISSEVVEKRISSQTSPLYVGFAPVHQLVDYSAVVNKPILIRSFEEAKRRIGYNDNWSDYTLCEPIYAHFINKGEIVAPIILLNVLDPSTMASEEKTKTLTFENGIAEIEDAGKIINKSISIDSLKNNEDYIVTYLNNGTKIMITDLSKTLSEDVEVKYKEIKTEMITKDLIIGSSDELGNKKGLEAIHYVYEDLVVIPSLLLCPKYSKIPDVREAMLRQLTPFAEHFKLFMYTDIPADNTVNTYKKAIAWKKANNYNSELEVVQYPMVQNGDKIFHLSVLRAVEDQIKTQEFKIPVEPASVVSIPAQLMVLENGTKINIRYNDAEELQSEGIATCVKFEGALATFGANTGIYSSTTASTTDVRKLTETTVRSIQVITNDFIRLNFYKLHKKLTQGSAYSITSEFQDKLDAYKQNGLLLYGQIDFVPGKNTLDKLEQGKFTFDIQITSGTIIKSLHATIQWTPKGLNTIFGEVQ